MTSKVELFLTASEEAEIIEAIRSAERNTSGEIRVHLESSANKDLYERATEVFHILHMDNTKQSNGVLIYVAVTDKKFVILGDSGINAVVPENFWESTRDTIAGHFAAGQMKTGLVEGINQAGIQLKSHFPYQWNDTNELSDEISTAE